MATSEDWKELAAEKRRSIHALIPQAWLLPQDLLDKYNETTPVSVLHVPEQFLSESELEITENYTVKELLASLASSKLSAVDVCNAFSRRAAIATQLTNCCTELMFEYGLERAKFLDEYLKKNGKIFGPLHGLPISLKDCFKVPGYDSTIGYVARIGNKDDTESDLVRQLSDLGAVFYVKTNIPQTLLTGDSQNNVFGRTLNPNNLTWTAGGSTGGEGALIKMRGSLLGMGNDSAGSLRIPPLCDGVYGFKPSSARYPNGNQELPSRDVFVGIPVASGPLSADLETIELVTKLVFDNGPQKYDFEALGTGYIDPCITEKDALKIGIVRGDHKFPIHPPMKRVINEAAEKLKRAGHIVEFVNEVPSYEDAWSYAWRLFRVDPKSTAVNDIFAAGEPFVKSVTLPGLDVYGSGPKDIDELICIRGQMNELKRQWMEIFNKYDVVISPGAPGSAPPHDMYGIAVYTTMWNVVDFPALVIPYGVADASIDVDDGAVYDAKLEHIYAHYDAEKYDGGICHLQISAPHMADEKLISASILINNVLKNCTD
jgi:amidase